MAILHVTTRGGVKRDIDAPSGISVMEAVREAGIYEILALCGGSRSCATCHIHVEEGWRSVVGEASGPELELLEMSPHYDETSRLSCQIEISDKLDGMRLRIAPED